MSARHRDDLLHDIVDLGRETLHRLEGVDLRTFLADGTLQRAVERTLELIGEAATRLGDQTPDIDVPWDKIKRMRIVLAHVYERVSPRILFATATEQLPPLVARLQAHLDEREATHP